MTTNSDATRVAANSRLMRLGVNIASLLSAYGENSKPLIRVCGWRAAGVSMVSLYTSDRKASTMTSLVSNCVSRLALTALAIFFLTILEHRNCDFSVEIIRRLESMVNCLRKYSSWSNYGRRIRILATTKILDS